MEEEKKKKKVHARCVERSTLSKSGSDLYFFSSTDVAGLKDLDRKRKKSSGSDSAQNPT